MNQYARAGPRNLSWDKRGNISGDLSWRFGHDVLDRLRTITGFKTDEALFYDAEDRLTRSTLNGVTTNQLLDGDDLVAEYDVNFALLRRFVPGPDMDEPLVQYEGASLTDRRWFASDQLGSVVALSDGSGNPIARYAYGRFGEPQTLLGTALPAFAYTGQRTLPGELGLYHYKARTYSPWLGRFLQTDPIGIEDDLNLYAYVGNDPVNSIDPMGTDGRTRSTATRWLNRGQGALDAIGVFDPTGIADGVNALIYLGRGQYGNATISAMGIIPYVGDLAKAGKYGSRAAKAADVGPSMLHARGLRPAPGTRVIPEGIPQGWRIRPTRSGGGVHYYNPKNPNENVRIMQGNPNSPYPNSQVPYARQQNSAGTYLRRDGTPSSLPRGGSRDPDAHIPLNQFKVRRP